MYLCDLTFAALGGDEGAAEEAHHLAASLARNGQVVGDYVLGRLGPDLRLTCTLPLPDSLDSKHRSKYVSESLSALERRSGQPCGVRVSTEPLGPGSVHLADPSEATFLVLKTTYTSLVSPLWDPKSGKHLPLYRVPISAGERERVFFWARNYQRLDGLWFGAPGLEVESYREMATVSSPLISQAREHAARIDRALNIPTYVWLVRHYGAPEGDEKRLCPGCQGSWRASAAAAAAEAAPFRCEPCRLASHLAFSTDAEDWARFADED